MTTRADRAGSRATAAITSPRAAPSASPKGSLLLEGTDDLAQRPARDPDERDTHREQRHEVRLEAQVAAAADVRADRRSETAATAAAVALFVRPAAETRPRRRDRDDLHAVDVLLLTVRRGHAELVSPADVAALQGLIDAGTLTDKLARQVLEGVIAGEGTPQEVVDARGLAVVSDDGALVAAIDEALAAQPDVLEKIKGGKVQAAGAIIGAVMKAMKGQADAARVRELILERAQ